MRRITLVPGLAVLLIGLAACSTARVDTGISNYQSDKLITTSSGLKYVDLVVGTGDSPAPTDAVTVQYTATLENGTVFDASRLHEDGGPASFALDSVIKGWIEGLSTMKVGGVRKLVIPPDLAYGDHSVGAGVIPPNSTLIFLVELLDIPKVKIDDTHMGTGAEAIDGATVVVSYTGQLADGTPFDSTAGKQPFDFVMGSNQVIPGWNQGLRGMKVGGKRTMTIPPGLAYGAQGAQDAVPPNTTLVFEVELLEVR
jgi:peptidylprolyl isomerase